MFTLRNKNITNNYFKIKIRYYQIRIENKVGQKLPQLRTRVRNWGNFCPTLFSIRI